MAKSGSKTVENTTTDENTPVENTTTDENTSVEAAFIDTGDITVSDTVTVACKLPNGLFMDVKGVITTINGFRTSTGTAIGGYGLTENINKDYFDAWMKEHADQPYVKKELIFALNKTSSAESKAAEYSETKSGLEGLPQDNPMPGIEKNDEAMKAQG